MINKKAVAILGGILVLILGTVGFLIFRNGDQKEDPTTTPPPTQSGDLPSEEIPGDDFAPVDDVPPVEDVEPTPTEPLPAVNLLSPVKISEGESLSPVLFYQGDGVAFMNRDGQLFQASLEETSSSVSLTNLQELLIPSRLGISRVIWPDNPNNNNFIVERMDAGKKRFSVYLSDLGEYKDFPEKFQYVNWVPGSDQILYVWFDNGKSTLNIANADGSGWKKLVDFWEPDNAIQISPDGRLIAFWQTENQQEPNKLNVVTADGKVFKSLLKEGINRGALWSPNGRQLVFVKESAGRKMLWMVNSGTGETRDLAVEVDELDRVVWSKDSKWIYAFAKSSNNIWQVVKVDAGSGTRQTLDVSGSVDGRELFLSSTGRQLFFRNVEDGNRLYYVDLISLGQ